MSGHPTVYEALRATAARRAAHPALIFEGQQISYAELLQRIDSTAEALVAHGIAYGDAFALYAQNCPEFLYCYYAAARIGAVYVPINPNMTAARLNATLGGARGSNMQSGGINTVTKAATRGSTRSDLAIGRCRINGRSPSRATNIHCETRASVATINPKSACAQEAGSA